MSQIQLLNIVVGAVLLLFGRRLFWLFVAAVGFLVGAHLAVELFGQSEESWIVLAVAAAVGIIGALLSLFLQRVVVGIAGFLAGGYLLYIVSGETGYASYAWIAFIIGGVVGAILVSALFDWALILLSSLLGATVITQSIPLEPTVSAVLFFMLLLGGAIVQDRQMRHKEAPAKRRGD